MCATEMACTQYEEEEDDAPACEEIVAADAELEECAGLRSIFRGTRALTETFGRSFLVRINTKNIPVKFTFFIPRSRDAKEVNVVLLLLSQGVFLENKSFLNYDRITPRMFFA